MIKPFVGRRALISWFANARELPVVEVASRLGLEVRHSPSADHCACPACGAERRHTKSHDRRGAVGIPHAHPGCWRCYQCEVGGDAIDFVAYALGGTRYRDLPNEPRNEVRRWFGGDCSTRITPAPARPPKYPPTDQVRALWSLCGRVDTDREVSQYLDSRYIDPEAVTRRGLARALPRELDLPGWARSWCTSGHRIVLPMRDVTGEIRSVLVRSIDRAATAKSLAPAGFARGGLVIACPLACALLRGDERVIGSIGDHELRIAITEGEIDTMIAASLYGVFHDAATIGVVSGSWTPELAARIPDSSIVVIATDNDSEGDRYAAAIVETLKGRNVALERWRPELA